MIKQNDTICNVFSTYEVFCINSAGYNIKDRMAESKVKDK